jgi:preprotein translocase subunit SecY
MLYFIMTNITIYGLSSDVVDLFANYRFIMAGASGSIMHLGIGPIVTASIILQLFVGAKIIKLDLQKKEDKAIYQGTQKVLVIVMIVVEAVPQIFGYLKPSDAFVSLVGGEWAPFLIVIQLIIGALLVFFMDELISKWGIGSGISLFIAAGVSQALFTGLFNWLPVHNPALSVAEQAVWSLDNPPAGVIPGAFYISTNAGLDGLVSGHYQTMFLGNSYFVNSLVALLGTIFIFFIVVYAESSRIELPLAHGRVRGARGRYPIRLIYASNIPVILMAALLANVSMFSLLLYQSNLPLLGGQDWIAKFPIDPATGGLLGTSPIGGGAWYLTNPGGINGWLMPILAGGDGAHSALQYSLKIIIYMTVLIVGSILFAKFWIETTDMGPSAVARQIQSSGMQIPGFRRDPRVLRKVLERYIPVVTVIGGAAVGALAGFADMVGTVGNASGTGLLLTVGIIIRLYEDIAKEQAMEMHPVLRGFFGNE